MTTPDPKPTTARADQLIRLAVWLAATGAFASQLAPFGVDDAVLPVLIFAALLAGFVVLSTEPIARAVHGFAESQPFAAAIAPLIVLVPAGVLSMRDASMAWPDVLISAVMLFLPVSAALISRRAVHRGDVWLGLVTAATPVLLPLARQGSFAVDDWPLRIGAIALPLALLLLATRAQRQRLNFLFACAVLSLWYGVEFGAFPDVPLSQGDFSIDYFHLSAMPVFLYVLAISQRFDRLGWSFKPSARGLSVVAANTALAAICIVPLGLVSNFLIPSPAGWTAPEAALRLLAIFLFVGLPEEVLFRGAIHTYLDDTLQLGFNPTLALSSLVFGLAHLNNAGDVAWFAVLATIAGVFYARAFIFSRNIAPAAAVHTAVDWLWSLVFRTP